MTMRPATLEDKQAVVAINDNVFDGRDYLPALYDSLVGSPSTKMLVCLHDDKIVSKCNLWGYIISSKPLISAVQLV